MSLNASFDKLHEDEQQLLKDREALEIELRALTEKRDTAAELLATTGQAEREFRRAVTLMLTGVVETDGDLLRTAFVSFDVSNTGSISADDFTRAIADITGTKLDGEVALRFFKSFDDDGDGVIRYDGREEVGSIFRFTLGLVGLFLPFFFPFSFLFALTPLSPFLFQFFPWQ